MSKKTKKDKVMPNPLAWFIYSTFSQILIRFKNKIKIDRTVFKNRNKKEGCIVIYNHVSKYDHFMTTATFKYSRVAYVISSHFYFKPILRMVLNWVRAISKDQFQSDIGTIKKIKRALNNKLPIAIAPVGQITMHGEALSMDKSFVKLLKMCNVDVYAIQIHGGYFAYPKWGKATRKNPIHINYIKLFNKEDLKTLSDDEIYQKAYSSIDIVDRNEVDKYHYNLDKKDLLLGIEDMLYKCPKCNCEDTQTTLDNVITCSKCGNSLKMNSRGVFEANSENAVVMYNETIWYNWEKNELNRQIRNNSLYLEGNFDIYHNLNEPYVLENLGSGKVVLTNDELYYEGTFNGESIRKDFKLSQITQFPFETRNHFAIPSEEGTFEFKPSEGEKASKIARFVQSVELLAKYRNEQKDNG